jgi:hypothetical protein
VNVVVVAVADADADVKRPTSSVHGLGVAIFVSMDRGAEIPALTPIEHSP